MRFLTCSLLVGSLLCLVVGCAPSRPSATMDSRVPYQFTYDGTVQKARSVLQNRLGKLDWALLNTDPGVVAATKVLSPDEMASQTTVTGGMVGAGAGGKRGRISFSLQRGDEGTVVRMRSKVATEGAPTGGRGTTKSRKRKHPLMVKMGLEINRLPGFQLTDPPASWLRKWQRAAR